MLQSMSSPLLLILALSLSVCQAAKPMPQPSPSSIPNPPPPPPPPLSPLSSNAELDILGDPVGSWNSGLRAVMHIGNYKITCDSTGNCTSIGDYYNSCNSQGTQSSALTNDISSTPFCTVFSYPSVTTQDGAFECSGQCTNYNGKTSGCQCGWTCAPVAGSYPAQHACGNPAECSQSVCQSSQSSCYTSFDHACGEEESGALIVTNICSFNPLTGSCSCSTSKDDTDCSGTGGRV